MNDLKKPKLQPVRTVNFDGETIRKVLFVDFAGGDKMVMVLESGKIVVLPVYRECPVQVGFLGDFQADIGTIIETVQNRVQAQISEGESLVRELTDIKNMRIKTDGMDSR
ncbi:MAG: hypothetical protein P1P89_13800 [Desulfobacterales bacterium]|nr:hypothetical protein [Desulfobacterales bacterium]